MSHISNFGRFVFVECEKNPTFCPIYSTINFEAVKKEPVIRSGKGSIYLHAFKTTNRYYTPIGCLINEIKSVCDACQQQQQAQNAHQR